MAEFARRLRRHVFGVGRQGGPVTGRSFRGEAGSTAVELPLGVALILFPIAMMVMVIPQWPERQTVATAAAKEAASLYADADSPVAGAAAAQATVDRTAANYGLPGLRLRLSG